MFTVTFKLFILVLFAFEFLEVSCRQQNGIYDDSVLSHFRSINDLVRVVREGDNDLVDINNNGPGVIASTITAPTTKTTKSETSVKPLINVNVTDFPTSENGTTKYVIVKRTLKNKDKVPLIGFGLLTFFGYLFSANLITLLLLFTNKMCVSKKKLHVLQSPTPIA